MQRPRFPAFAAVLNVGCCRLSCLRPKQCPETVSMNCSSCLQLRVHLGSSCLILQLCCLFFWFPLANFVFFANSLQPRVSLGRCFLAKCHLLPLGLWGSSNLARRPFLSFSTGTIKLLRAAKQAYPSGLGTPRGQSWCYYADIPACQILFITI